MNGIQWQLDGVYPARESNENPRYLGRAAFTFVPPSMRPLKIVRSYEKKNSKGEKEFGDQVTVEIEPGARVMVKSSAVLVSKNGEHYVRCELDLPWDFAREVGDAAAARLAELVGGAVKPSIGKAVKS